MTNPEAYLQCRCGACVIALADPKVRARTQCFCLDCRQRGLISEALSPENALPDEVRNFERGVDLAYFSNSLIVNDSSQQLLEFSKLTAEGSNTTAMSSCCGTLMCGTHPLYEGNTISVNTDSCRVNVPSDIPVDAVVFTCDAPAEKAALIAEQSSIPVIFDVFGSLDSPVIQNFIAAVTAPMLRNGKIEGAVTFEGLCATKTLTICNDFYIENINGKTTKSDRRGKS
ncbi:MAG: hypothetical protein AB8B81_14350 [Halioglobus sp.]